MHHSVEIRHIGHDLAAAMNELHHWLRQKHIQPMEFEQSVGGPGITIRCHFREQSEAVAFAKAFHGWLNDGSHPGGIARWAFCEHPTDSRSRQ